MENTTKTEIDSRMFNSVAVIQIGEHSYNAILYAVKISDNEIIPVVITSKSLFKKYCHSSFDLHKYRRTHRIGLYECISRYVVYITRI